MSQVSRHLRYFCIVLTPILLTMGCKREPNVQATIGNDTAVSTIAATTKPFDNIDPEVQYASEDSCAECHAEIAEQYARHPMGRSLARIDTEWLGATSDDEKRGSFVAGIYEYHSAVADGQLIHGRALVGEGRGTDSVREEHPIAFVVGSGQRGRSYVVNHEGRFLMSPLTWYPQKGNWDLSPGYEHNDLGFGRPVLEDCLYCHSNRAHLVAHQKNQYAASPFSGHAIGCQRCHGPGELHVRSHREGRAVAGEYDRTIANPAHLEPSLREAVCQQCHLSGSARVLAEGKDGYDFRPGMPLEDVISTYVLNPSRAATANHFVGQVEQMYSSRCFTESEGRLGCISCHDPHFAPGLDERAQFYHDRCVACHAEEDCTKPLESRLNADGIDDCVSCHMPSIETDVRHAATTDHRIPRLSTDPPRQLELTKSSLAVVPFPPRPRRVDEIEEDRNRAIAIFQAAPYHPKSITPREIRAATVPLQKAISRHPLDLVARETLADVLGTRKPREAEKQYKFVLEQQPLREHSMVQRADLYADARADDAKLMSDALRAWREIYAHNPWNPVYAERLANLLAEVSRWEEVRSLATEITGRFPTSPVMWRYLVESNLNLGEHERAQQAFHVLLRFHPDRAAELRSWFEAIAQARD